MSLFDDDVTEGQDAPETESGDVSVALLSPSRGRVKGDVLEVSEERAVELVLAGLAKRV